MVQSVSLMAGSQLVQTCRLHPAPSCVPTAPAAGCALQLPSPHSPARPRSRPRPCSAQHLRVMRRQRALELRLRSTAHLGQPHVCWLAGHAPHVCHDQAGTEGRGSLHIDAHQAALQPLSADARSQDRGDMSQPTSHLEQPGGGHERHSAGVMEGRPLEFEHVPVRLHAGKGPLSAGRRCCLLRTASAPAPRQLRAWAKKPRMSTTAWQKPDVLARSARRRENSGEGSAVCVTSRGTSLMGRPQLKTMLAASGSLCARKGAEAPLLPSGQAAGASTAGGDAHHHVELGHRVHIAHA